MLASTHEEKTALVELMYERGEISFEKYEKYMLSDDPFEPLPKLDANE